MSDPMRRILLTVSVLIGMAVPAGAADEAATWSFAVGEGGTIANAVSVGGGKITVDLSALPKSAAIFRAVLRFSRDVMPGRGHEGDAVVKPPEDECTVNLTLRRLQKFAVKPGQKFTWSAAPVVAGPASQPQGATVEADKDGLITLEKVTVPGAGVRLKIVPAP